MRSPFGRFSAKFLLAVLSFTSGTVAWSQADVALIRAHLQENRIGLGLSESDVQDWRVVDRPGSKAKGVSIVHTIQTVYGLDVHNAIGTFVLRDGRVVHFADRFLRDLRSRVVPAGGGLRAGDALREAARALRLPGDPSAQAVGTADDGRLELRADGIARGTVKARRIMQPTSDGRLHLAWDLSIRTHRSTEWWLVAVDANSGELLRSNNIVVECSFPGVHDHEGDDSHVLHDDMEEALGGGGAGYRVYPMPIESPSHGVRSLVTDPHDVLASPYGWHDVDGVPGAEYTITQGNNVFAADDIDDDDLPGYSPDGGASLDFDFPLDLGNAPVENLDASVTNLFFWNNLMHDVWYQYGFDEQSGNFQENNYDRGGEGFDAVFAQAQDGGGTNNANFATPPDGEAGRMQMFNWTGTSLGNNLTINAPGALAGSYFSAEAGFGPGSPTIPLTGNVAAMVDDTAPTGDGCDGLLNAAQISGRFALVDRGNCSFVQKVEAAQNAGAIAVLVVNNQPGNPTAMGGTSSLVTIPAVMISDVLGAQIRAALQAGTTVNVTLQDLGQTADRDGSFDNGVVAHEYGHGISTRLTGGASNVECLFNADQMGEGWSDWVGLMLTIEPGDQPEDVRGIGTFAIGQSITSTGIRPAPYTTNTAINGFTYAATNDENGISQPHGIGFVWCTMLWDMTWDLIDLYGFDPDVYTGDGGNNIAMSLVIEAMKLQPCNPGFVDGRDAILQADELLFGGANRCLIWRAFAERGLGFSAEQGSTEIRTDQVEAFDLPPSCQLPTTAPSASFDMSVAASCSGTVSFTDLSTDVPQAWAWQFGDGGTSDQPEPTHTYTASGTYTVTLTVSNIIGSDVETRSVTIDLPEAPAAADIDVCAGTAGTLEAEASGEAFWYDVANTELASGSTFTTPVLSGTTTYLVRNVVASESAQVGPLTNAFGTGAYHGTAFIGTVNFTAFQAVTIVSCWVDAGSAGTRTINLWNGPNGTGTLVQSVQVVVPAGQGRIQLGLQVPGPGQYSIGTSNGDLYRNDTGAQYPYTIAGLISLTGSSASTGHYYYLYDLEVSGAPCTSPATEVTANVVEADFTFEASGATLTFTDASTGATSWAWAFGDGATSTEQDPVHTYTAAGNYTITLTINGIDCSTTSTWEINTAVNGPAPATGSSVLPNPASEEVMVDLGPGPSTDRMIEVYDTEGRLVLGRNLVQGTARVVLDVSGWSPGAYQLLIRSSEAIERHTLLIAR
jgi:PKD repeat protein